MTSDAPALNERVAALSPVKRVLLARRLGERASPAGNTRKVLAAYWSGAASEQQLRAFLAPQLPEYMQPNVWLPLAELPTTAVGKLDYKALPLPAAQRSASRQALPQDRSPIEQTLQTIWQDVLRVNAVHSGDNFFALGGDSILGLQVVSRARREGLQLVPRDIFEFETLADLAAAVELRVDTAPPAVEPATVREPTPPVPAAPQQALQLTPIERWFFTLQFDARQHWNMPMLMAVREGIDVGRLEQALATVTASHSELSCSYRQQPQGWVRVPRPACACAFDIYDFRDLPPTESIRARDRTLEALQRSLDLQRGVLFRTAYFPCVDQQDVMLLLAHHLCIDGVSWRCLLDEIEETYAALAEGRTPRLNAPSVNFIDWASVLLRAAQRDLFAEERAYWLQQKPAAPVVLPLDYPATVNLEGDATVVRASLSAEETEALLQHAHLAYKTTVPDLLVAALSRSVLPWADADELCITLEQHGRDVDVLECDVSSTLGWFTAIFPLRIERENDAPAQLLRATKERLRKVPNGGVGYGVLRYLDPVPANRDSLADDYPPQLALNYFGQINAVATSSLFTGMVDGALKSARSPTAPRAAVFEVQAMISNGLMHIDWIYSSKLHRAATVQALLDSYMLALRELLAHCLAPGSGGYTPSDFPKAELDQDDLDDLLAGLD